MNTEFEEEIKLTQSQRNILRKAASLPEFCLRTYRPITKLIEEDLIIVWYKSSANEDFVWRATEKGKRWLEKNDSDWYNNNSFHIKREKT